ncbi:MAG TPA: tetratricopeptide repeat protein [Gemmatimonadales bacterium]|nr:tetratricopeptide repeat protein [Gemmatimonadales bacterium]
MATSEIEKLERRYAENPHGLTFAPLAEVHRKNGDVARALELLTAGLELHPNYIPASIVLGRCHHDLGDLPSAEAAFAHVLRLDDENVIALKSLADINERQERFGEAETWLRRLVSVDRSNDEAREQLRRVEAARQGSKSAAAETPAPAAALELIDLTPEPAVESAEPAQPSPELLPVDVAAVQPSPSDQPPPDEIAAGIDEPRQGEPIALAATSMAQDREPARPAEPEPEPEAEAEPAASAEAPVSDGREDEEEAGPVQPLPGLISAEFQPPLESTGGLGVETSEEVVLEASGNSEFRVPDASEDLKSLAARLSSPSAAPAPERHQEAAPVEPEPDSPGELRFLVNAPMDAAVEEPPPQRRSYAATDTKGQSVAAFFQALVGARPPAGPALTGKQDGARDAPSGEAPAVPPAVPAQDPRADAAVSFDDFFESEAEGSKALRQQASDPGKDDLDQFQSWLQNLKR